MTSACLLEFGVSDIVQAKLALQDADLSGCIDDTGLEADLLLVGIQRVDDVLVVGINDVASELACAGDFTVVCVELFVQIDKAPDLQGGWQDRVGVGDEAVNEFGHPWLLGELGIRRVGNAAFLGPVPHCLKINADDGSEKIAILAQHADVPNVMAELQAVFYIGGDEALALRSVDDLGGASQNDQLAIVLEIAGVAGVEPAVLEDFGGLFGLLIVAVKDIVAFHEDFA